MKKMFFLLMSVNSMYAARVVKAFKLSPVLYERVLASVLQGYAVKKQWFTDAQLCKEKELLLKGMEEDKQLLKELTEVEIEFQKEKE